SNNRNQGTEPKPRRDARFEFRDVDYDDETVLLLEEEIWTGNSVHAAVEVDHAPVFTTHWRSLLRPHCWHRSGAGRLRRWDDCNRGGRRRRRGRRGQRRRGQRRGRRGLGERKGQSGGVTTPQRDRNDLMRLGAFKA